MPGMTGTELAEKLRQGRPALPVIVISGYIESGDLRAFDNVLVLTKPIALSDLFAAIGRVLGRTVRVA
jgi:CheY-like chemotaxis protein